MTLHHLASVVVDLFLRCIFGNVHVFLGIEIEQWSTLALCLADDQIVKGVAVWNNHIVLSDSEVRVWNTNRRQTLT